MKLAILKDDRDKIAPLWRTISIETIDGISERVNASMGRSSVLPNADVIIGNDMLAGEINLLSGIYPLVINDNRLIRYENLASNYPEVPAQGKVLEVGWCSESSDACLSTIGENSIQAIYPFPFRDESFNSVVNYEVLDYDAVRESHRVLRKGGKIYLVFRDSIFGGVKPSVALKFLIKFSVSSVAIKQGYWILEGKKVR
ncbi:methylase [Metallosphaera hakonensis]|uniref:Methylase n=1 Tax=Metallosphaera hakonensis JCM 8857 = DSM 7519 TaxID=1293036 RepID=A0A2U9IW04_9CREN|nr:methylase [Metallosphaera hakonensis]AWS00185.1 methylase [Metallosphaera hakonensis JCM 8857 = DSM 7519]